MDLLDTVKAVQEDLQKEKLSLSAWEESLKATERDLIRKNGELLEWEKQLKEKAAEVDGKYSVIAHAEAQKQLAEELTRASEDNRKALAELKRKENDLFEINQTLKDKEAALDKRAADLTAEKDSYKETIKREFFEQLEKNLPR